MCLDRRSTKTIKLATLLIERGWDRGDAWRYAARKYARLATLPRPEKRRA